MNKSVSHYISELLFLHDCVIVPKFGGFVSNPKSAQLNKTTGALTPPSKQILFNPNLKTNDGLLIAHIAKLSMLWMRLESASTRTWMMISIARLCVLRAPCVQD